MSSANMENIICSALIYLYIIYLTKGPLGSQLEDICVIVAQSDILWCQCPRLFEEVCTVGRWEEICRQRLPSVSISVCQGISSVSINVCYVSTPCQLLQPLKPLSLVSPSITHPWKFFVSSYRSSLHWSNKGRRQLCSIQDCPSVSCYSWRHIYVIVSEL